MKRGLLPEDVSRFSVVPALRSSSGQLLIGSPRNAWEDSLMAAGATSMIHRRDGAFRGVYVDNETPDRDLASKHLRAQLGPSYLVVVGLYPSEPSHRIPGCISLYEWYPFHGPGRSLGMPTRTVLGVPPTHLMPEAWCLQWSYAWRKADGFPFDASPPTPTQRRNLLLWVKARHPRAKLVWLY